MAGSYPGQLPEEENKAALILQPPHEEVRFQHLARHLRSGQLVAFPTETVYGLGANGLDPEAVLKIFSAKGRPLTDPCILHVASAADALPLLDLDSLPDGKPLFDELTKAFWPGPLSIVAPARSVVPPEVTARTGFVAVRCPAHPIARQLVQASGVPLAAPSANRFGHISPTQPQHVLEDLQHVPFLQIIDGGPCTVGIESTVLKLDTTSIPRCVRLLRRGGVAEERLEAFLADCFAQGKLQEPVSFVASKRSPVVKEEGEAQQAPGMLLKHYAPSVLTVLLSGQGICHERMDALPRRTVLIDFNRGRNEQRHIFLKVFDLCEDAHSSADAAEEACRHVFSTLRTAEAFALAEKAEMICITDFDPSGLSGYAQALHDRLFRSASGRRVILKSANEPEFWSVKEAKEESS